MKKFRGLIVAAAVLVVAVAAYVILTTVDFSATEDVSSDVPSTPTELSYLIDVDAAEVSSVTVENDNTYTIITDDVAEDESLTYSLEDDGFAYIDGLISAAAVGLISITTDPEPIATGDLAQYGLDTPAAVVTVEATSGDIIYEIGDAAPGDSEYYAKLADSDDVYLIPSSDAMYALDTKHQFRDRSVFSYVVGTDIESEIFESFVLQRSSGPTIELTARESIDEFGSAFEMTSPYMSDTNDVILSEDIFTFFSSLSYSEIIEDNPEDLEQYGIANVIEEEQTDDEETPDTDNEVAEPLVASTTATFVINDDLTITLGDFTDESETAYYATVSGVDSVVTFPSSAFPFIDIDYIELMSSLLWLHNIVEVETVDMTTPSGTYELALTHFPAETEEDTAYLEATLDGESIEEDFAKDIYLAILSVTMSSDLDEDPEIGESEYSFTINKMDGYSQTMDFYRINERQYGAVKDGEPLPFYVNIDLLNDVDEIILGIKDGTHTG